MGDKLTVNYWTWKDSELLDKLETYGVKMDPWNREEAIELLKKKDKEIVIVDEEGHNQTIEALKTGMPQLMLSRVIFHNTNADDLPYIFVGHSGSSFYLPKDIEIDVPDYILNSCIKDAVEDRMQQVVMSNGDISWKVRRVQRFPYSMIKKSFPAP